MADAIPSYDTPEPSGGIATGPPGSGAGLPAPAPAAIGLGRVCTGAFLVTAGPDGPVAVPGLRLTLGPDDVVLSGPDGANLLSIPWGQVAGLRVLERLVLPDGGPGIVLAVTDAPGHGHHVVLPVADPASAEADVERLAHRLGIDPVPHVEPVEHTPAVIVAAVLVVTAGLVAVLLLAAGHLIHLSA